jgi:hypothetical protein
MKQRQFSSKSSRTSYPSKRTVIWAAQSFAGSLGEYVGVAYERGSLTIAIRAPLGVRWVDADKALSTAEAEAWVHDGFGRGGRSSGQ